MCLDYRRSKWRVFVTLWGSFAEVVQKYMSKYTIGPVVVALQWCHLEEYNNDLIFTNSMYATRVFINADIPEIRSFSNGLALKQCVGPAIGIRPLGNAFKNSNSGRGFFHCYF